MSAHDTRSGDSTVLHGSRGRSRDVRGRQRRRCGRNSDSGFRNGQLGPGGSHAPTLTQPFAPLTDTNYYAPLPGESWDGFSATGWSLSGGAKVVSTKLADGTTGTALDLPASANAVSPSMCITSDYPSARGQIRSVSGSAASA